MIKLIHSYWAIIVLTIIVLSTVNALVGYFSKKEFKDKDLRISLFALITTHIQVLIGLGYYFMSPVYQTMKANGMGYIMKDAELRKQAVEHPIMMILAVVFITIGFSKHKKKESDNDKFKTITMFYTLALIFVLAMIPWSTWLGLS